jgi:glycosyltransferase involved in cell wall biosynthesis
LVDKDNSTKMFSSCSIVICTRDRAPSLARTLKGLASVRVPPGLTAEVIVADNGSHDQTASVVQTAQVPGMMLHYLFEPRPGQCYARNAGIEASKGEIIIFLDDDVLPPADWLEAMCAPIVSGQADAVAGGIVIAPSLVRPWMGPMHRSWLASTERLASDAPETMVGGNMAFARAVLERVPAFDTDLGPGRLGFGDDTLFGQQLKAAGFHLSNAFSSPVEHHFDPDRLTRSSLLATARKQGQTEAYLDYHWRHRDVPCSRLRILWARVRLAAWRLRRPREWFRKEGAAESEMYHVQNLSWLRQYMNERCKPRAYDAGGLEKKGAAENAC